MHLNNINSLNLDLCGNSIDNKGVKLISSALSQFQNINSLKLNLCGNSIGDEGAEYISSTLS